MKWLSTQVAWACKRLANAEKELGDAASEVSLINLINEFHKQQEFQSRPISHKYKLHGLWTKSFMWYYVGLKKDQAGKFIDLIISMSHSLESIKALVAKSWKELMSLIMVDAEGSIQCQADLCDRIKAKKSSAEQLEWWIQAKMSKLRKISSTASHDLKKLRKDEWLNLQLMLRVLGDQIVSKLWAWKFELANLDHAYWSWMLGRCLLCWMCKVAQHSYFLRPANSKPCRNGNQALQTWYCGNCQEV